MSASDRSRSRLPELAAAVGSLLALAAIFLPWYATDPQSRVSNIDGRQGDQSMWLVHDAMRWVLLVLVVLMALMTLSALLRPSGAAGFVDPIMVMAVNAMGIVLWFGFVYRPGDPMQTISLSYGWFLALAGTLTPLVMNAYRAKATMRRSAGIIGTRAA